MKMKLNVGIATAGIAVVLLAGCVSSKKYKSSQATLQQVRNDSAQLAQQVASLNQNVQSLQEKNSALQRSLDSNTNMYAAQQKNLGYYQDYFKQQQTTATQMSDELRTALTQSGVANGDVQVVNNTIYVKLDENSVFKKNSTTVTTSGKQALNSLADAIKKQSDVNVFVNDGDSSTGQGSMAMSSSSTTGNATVNDNGSMSSSSDNNGSASTSSTSTVRHHRTHRAARKSTMGNDEKSTATASTSKSATDATPDRTHAVAHHRVHHKYSSESSSTTYYSNMGKSSGSKSWMLKQHRMGVVANSFLQSGIPKVNITMKQPDMNGGQPGNTIAVVITPKMSDFNPQTSASAADNK